VYLLAWDTDPIGPLKNKHSDIDFVRVTSVQGVIAELDDVDILIVAGRYYPGELAAAVHDVAPKLRWIQTASIGIDMFAKGGVPGHVIFTNAAGLKGSTVAEHAMALLLATMRALPRMEQFRAAGEWASDALRPHIASLEGKTLIAIGYGSIGREIARKAKAFDMHVIAVNRSGHGEGAADKVVAIGNLDTVLPQGDAVVVSLPLNSTTKALIGAAQFEAIKPSAILVNVGRGPVVDQTELRTAIRDGQIGAAALDVFDEEPLPSDDELWRLPNVIVSPHVGGSGGAMYERFAELVSRNIDLFHSGEPLLNQISIDENEVPQA